MADITLHDGREWTADLYKLTRQDFKKLLDPKNAEDDDDRILALVWGVKVEELKELSQPDYDQVVTAVFNKRRAMMANPT